MKIELITREEYLRRTQYWMFITEYYCPVCSKTDTYRNRMPMPKPEDWDDRHDVIEMYDYCNAL